MANPFARFKPVWAAAVAVVGAAFFVGGYVLTARDVVKLGLPVPIWQAIGAAMFVAMIGVMLYQHKNPERRVETDLELVRDRTFHDQTIRLDGYEYLNCTFVDCLFQYDGGKYRLTSPVLRNVKRAPGITTQHNAVGGALELLIQLGLLPPGNLTRTLDEGDPPHV